MAYDNVITDDMLKVCNEWIGSLGTTRECYSVVFDHKIIYWFCGEDTNLVITIFCNWTFEIEYTASSHNDLWHAFHTNLKPYMFPTLRDTILDFLKGKTGRVIPAE